MSGTYDGRELPRYDQLPAVEGAPAGSGWWLFGRDDQVGLVNLMTPEKAVQAAGLVKRGAAFPLNWELEQPDPPMFGRGGIRHTILAGSPVGRDDLYDNFYPQASSQWDSLVHVGNPEHGFYNGVTAEQITGKPGTRGGIEHWARRGMVTRGVLLDVARHRERQGRPVDGSTDERFSVELLEETRRAQGVEIQTGDVLLIRGGWMAWYLQASEAQKRALTVRSELRLPGIESGPAMAEYLWNLHIAAIASDTPSVEAWPPDPARGGFMHFTLIGLFGMPIGEMFYLEALADDCARDGVYEFMLTSAPLNKLGGIGSPPNAIAIK